MARGSISKRNGGYVYRIDLGADPESGKRRQLSRQGFRNKKEAERALEEHLAQIRSGTHVEATRMTTADYLDRWLENQKLRLKQTTWEATNTTRGLDKRTSQLCRLSIVDSFYVRDRRRSDVAGVSAPT